MSVSFINAWKYQDKSWNKHALKLRIGRITIIDLYIDRKNKLWGIVVFNYGLRKNRG